MCGFYQLVCFSWAGPHAEERKENPELPLPSAPRSFSAAYSKRLPGTKEHIWNECLPCLCISEEGGSKLTWGSEGLAGLPSPGKFYGTIVVWARCRPGSKELWSPITFLWVLSGKSHNWTPKANVLLVKKTNGSKFACSADSSSCRSGCAKKTWLPEPGSQVAVLRREQLAGAQMRCDHYQFLKKDLKASTTNYDGSPFHKS